MLNDIEPQAYQVNKLENNTDVLAIVMCVWKRIEDFDLVVQQFNNQTFKNFKLFIWNNNTDPKYKNTFEEILNKKATFDWHIHHSNKNIGGFGRFYMAKQLRKVPGLANYVVFVDDDQRWGYDLLSTFWNEREPKTIKAQFGWRFDGNDYYRNRVHVSPGNSLHYTGTGGMILDNMIFEDDNLYEKCMPDHWWVEDLWLSYWANHIHGYKLTKSAASMKNGDDEHSLYRVVKDKKTPMLRWLLKEGNWGILNNSAKISTIMTSYLGDYPGSRTNPIEKFHRAINSWLNQDYQNKELIIVSDGCPITEAEVGKWNHIEQIKLVRANKSEATWPGSRRQMGVDAATGDWITYLDTDDMYAPNYLSEVANVITKHRDKQFILNRCLTQKIEDEHSDQSVNVILKPVSITNGLSKFVLNGETHYYANRDSTTNSYSSAQIIHQKNIPYKWQDSDRRGEDVDFANKFKAEAIKISQPGYIICHMGHGASLDL
jgi:glycosyltransferase involved in cell wall biosynthesis